MTWHLKDRELERKLNKFSDGEFSRILNEHTGPNESDCIVLELEKNNNIELSVYIRPEAIEEIPDYNPKGWNEYPKVTPPENILMRVEAVGRSGVFRDCAIFKDGVWQSDMDGEACGEFYAKVKRFRPWED